MNRTTTSQSVCSRETIYGSPVYYRNIFLNFIKVIFNELSTRYSLYTKNRNRQNRIKVKGSSLVRHPNLELGAIHRLVARIRVRQIRGHSIERLPKH